MSGKGHITSELPAICACLDLKSAPSFSPAAQHGGINEGKSIFSQLIGFLPDRDLRRFMARYGGDLYTKTLSCWEQFLAMAFAQLACRESLRDIEACLGG